MIDCQWARAQEFPGCLEWHSSSAPIKRKYINALNFQSCLYHFASVCKCGYSCEFEELNTAGAASNLRLNSESGPNEVQDGRRPHCGKDGKPHCSIHPHRMPYAVLVYLQNQTDWHSVDFWRISCISISTTSSGQCSSQISLASVLRTHDATCGCRSHNSLGL